MTDILALLQCLHPYLTKTAMRQMSHILPAIITMTGRVTMLGISRWTEKGGSYRTIQRFYTRAIPWALIFWLFVRQHLVQPGGTYLLAGDESVVTKSGKATFGLDRFFASLAGKVIPSLAFFALSLIDVEQRRSYPTAVEQVVRSETAKAVSQAQKKERKKKTQKRATGSKPTGRPKGSRNQNKSQVVWTPELRLIHNMIQKQLCLIGQWLTITHLLLDGKFGHNNAVQMALGCGLHLVSKLRHDAALYLPYDGPYSGHGPHRKYGDKINYAAIPAEYLKETSTQDDIQTYIYQATMLHKGFAARLNVVIIRKHNVKTDRWAQVLLFSSDLDLTYAQLIDYYSLRFQIEFNFREAKQYWGLEDFMNVQETAVTNAANLSLFLVNVAQVLMRHFRQQYADFNVLDLKAFFRGRKYVAETLKLLPEKPEPILISHILEQVSQLGSIHYAPSSSIAT
jgi:putative transposase